MLLEVSSSQIGPCAHEEALYTFYLTICVYSLCLLEILITFGCKVYSFIVYLSSSNKNGIILLNLSWAQ